MLLRPLPPFRAKPSRKPLAPKVSSENRKDGDDVSVKARRLPIKFPRPTAPPSLKVLSR
jgi:hypothetical protein